MTVAFDACGVYRIRNLVTGKSYVGSSVTLGKRRSAHFRSLTRGDHHSEPLQRAFRKHGADALSFEVLILCDRKNVRFYEQQALDVLRPEYNACPVAGSCLGQKLTAEHKAKIGAAHKGKTTPAETRAKMSAAAKGKPKSEAHLEKIRALNAARRGKPGHAHTAETKDKIGAAHKGRVFSDAHRSKIGQKTRERARLAPDQVREIRRLREAGEPLQAVASWAGISVSSVGDIIHGRTYSYVLD